jgi:hypothetical protein
MGGATVNLDFGLWNAVVSTATLLVVAGTAIAALRQIRHLRAQNTLAGLLKVLEDWRDPEFEQAIGYVRLELPAKLQEPGYLEDLDRRSIDRAKHRELVVCEWYEQLGSYLKYGLLDERIVMDVASSSSNAAWAACEPVIMRMRQTRSDALFENFEYFVARGVLFERAHPNGCYPSDTPRMADLGGAHAYGKPIETPATEISPAPS